MLKKILLICVLAMLVFSCGACEVRDTDIENPPLHSYTYTLTKTDFVEVNHLESISFFHPFRVLDNNSIVEMKFASSHGGADHYRHFIYDENCENYQITHANGSALAQYIPYYRVVLETDEGNVIASDAMGKAAIYDREWNKISDINDIYFAISLDGGRYFAINDTEKVEIDYAIGVDGYQQKEKYALYRYTEKLTDCKYSSITPCEGGFECIYPDENSLHKSDTIYVDDKIPLPEPEIVPMYNEQNGKYYFADSNGNKIIEDEFDYISNIANNRAVVLKEDNFYILDLVVS